jgi:hypothetical protein
MGKRRWHRNHKGAKEGDDHAAGLQKFASHVHIPFELID